MFDQILIPTDGSDPAHEAAQKGVELAVEHDAVVHVLYVVEPVPLGKFTAGPEPASAEHEAFIEEQKAEMQSETDALVDLCEERNLDVVDAIEYGDPHEAIIEYATENEIDGIVIGTHGRSGPERVVIGSVTERVVRNSPVPVITIRGTE